MMPANYVVPAERVVEILKDYRYYSGEKPHRQAPMSRSQLLDALKIKKPREQRRFAQQLQHMSHKCYAAYRISFQYYPTGWIYDPPIERHSPQVEANLNAGRERFDLPPTKMLVAAVDVTDIKIVCEWASRQWVSGPAHNAFKRLREAAK